MDLTSYLNVCLPVILGWLYRLDKRVSRIETTLSLLTGIQLENNAHRSIEQSNINKRYFQKVIEKVK